MIRAGAAMAVLAAVGLFGYFYLQDNSAGSRADKARAAVERVGGVAKDQGTAGLVRVLEILEEELVVAMGLLGVTSIDQLSPAYVRQAEAVVPPHEMSAWVNMPEGRIL